jgi:mRNA degradation ribonuclease J1/J2
MDKYQRGKVYAIICNKTGRRYIGSTVETNLARRLSKHVSDFNRWKKGIAYFSSSFEIIKDENYYIILLESYPCNSKDELRMCEQKHIDLCECLNKRKSFQSDEELIEYNKQYYKQYREQNRAKINAKQNERVCCPNCQKEMNKNCLSRHKKTCQSKNEIVTDVI